MILELRSYTFRSGTLDEAIARFETHIPFRMQFSTMAGMWAARSGIRDRLIHIWPYETIQQRMEVRAAAEATGKWPLPIRDLLIESQSTIIIPATFAPALEPRRLGRCYELHIDKYLPGAMRDLEAGWGREIARRQAIAPLVTCGRTEIGPLNHWVHLWAYEDAGHRAAVEAELNENRIWPPADASDKLVTRDSVLLEPVPFSLLR
jgi:hypothetical protein